MSENKLKATVASILIFAVIELVAFIGLLVLFKRKFGYSPLHQLAFVFEMQFCTVQEHLIIADVMKLSTEYPAITGN
ncbi:hypothetical protein F442_01833 [Phytophthora nicotianae P10297]|uniref:Uncharacterized protein n=1 Tax=Phytophthora nicotianae P10297 TaxID=1317064 RepID=W3A403_PHYNI|nr:hypothetical protein F442_01833 [Phytophthora nicotianae P10297]